MDVEALKAAVKSANGECERKLAEMTEDEKKAMALRCVPELVVGVKVLCGLVLDCVKNGKVLDKSTDDGKMAEDIAGFVGGLASSLQQILGFDEKMATHDFSTTFGITQMMKNLCEGKKE